MNERCKFDRLPCMVDQDLNLVPCEDEERYCMILTEKLVNGLGIQGCVLPLEFQKHCIHYSVD